MVISFGTADLRRSAGKPARSMHRRPSFKKLGIFSEKEKVERVNTEVKAWAEDAVRSGMVKTRCGRNGVDPAQCGDLSFYTKAALVKRVQLKGARTVQKAINLLWSVLPKQRGAISKETYLLVFNCVAEKVLKGRPRTAKQMEADWSYDAGLGRKTMDATTFCNAVFDMVDTWCGVMKETDYAELASNCAHVVHKELYPDAWERCVDGEWVAFKTEELPDIDTAASKTAAVITMDLDGVPSVVDVAARQWYSLTTTARGRIRSSHDPPITRPLSLSLTTPPSSISRPAHSPRHRHRPSRSSQLQITYQQSLPYDTGLRPANFDTSLLFEQSNVLTIEAPLLPVVNCESEPPKAITYRWLGKDPMHLHTKRPSAERIAREAVMRTPAETRRICSKATSNWKDMKWAEKLRVMKKYKMAEEEIRAGAVVSEAMCPLGELEVYFSSVPVMPAVPPPLVRFWNRPTTAPVEKQERGILGPSMVTSMTEAENNGRCSIQPRTEKSPASQSLQMSVSSEVPSTVHSNNHGTVEMIPVPSLVIYKTQEPVFSDAVNAALCVAVVACVRLLRSTHFPRAPLRLKTQRPTIPYWKIIGKPQPATEAIKLNPKIWDIDNEVHDLHHTLTDPALVGCSHLEPPVRVNPIKKKCDVLLEGALCRPVTWS